MHTYQAKIRLHHTDSGGTIFFASQFKIIQDASEDFLEKSGLNFEKIFKKSHYFLPVVHAESNFKKPLQVGDKVTIIINISSIGKSFFSFEYTLKKGKMIVGTAQIIHVAIDKKTRKKILIPRTLRAILKEYQKG